MPKNKAGKESGKAMLASVKKEMGKPRVAKSAEKVREPRLSGCIDRSRKSSYSRSSSKPLRQRAVEEVAKLNWEIIRGALLELRHSLPTTNLAPNRKTLLKYLLSGEVMQAIASSGKAKSKITLKEKRAFNVQSFLDSAGVARKVVQYRRSQKIYSQGDPATTVMYLQEGGAKLSVVNEVGKEAVVGILGPGDFFGEGCLAGQAVRMGTATTITPSAVLVIEKDEMMRVLHAEHALSDRFMSYILSRNIRIEEDLIDQLFNSSEKRLARTLLLLARYGKEAQPQKIVPKVSQEMLAEMIGTTRSRVNFFMNKFRKLGFIQYNGGLQVHSSLLSVVLHE